MNDTEFKYWENYKKRANCWILSPDQKPQAGILKDAADRYPFLAKVMYGSQFIRPLVIFVTSNYSMNDLYDSTDYEALHNRFYEIKFGLSYMMPLMIQDEKNGTKQKGL